MNNQYHSDTSVVILAAGQSTRMMQPKLFLKFNENESFVEHIINVYRSFGCGKILIVLNNNTFHTFEKIILKNHSDIEYVINNNLEYERFYSVKLGIESLKNSSYIYLQNVDNPFVNEYLLDLLYASRSKTGYVVPVYNNMGGHPILIGEDITESIHNTNKCDINLKKLLRQFKRIELETDDKNVLININTVQDYQNYFQKL